MISLDIFALISYNLTSWLKIQPVGYRGDKDVTEPAPRRGRTHDAEGARKAILDAAEKVFAEHGFDGARIDAIAAEAAYNKSLIFQYFDDKLGLYAEVIRRADDQTRGLQTEAFAALLDGEIVSDPHKLRALIERWLRAYFDYLVEHPNIARIYLWEMAEGWQTYAKILSQRDYEDVEQISAVLPKLQRSGVLRSDFDPIIQFTMGVFLEVFYLGLVPVYRIFLPDEDLSSADALERGREFVIQFILQGIMADPAKTRP